MKTEIRRARDQDAAFIPGVLSTSIKTICSKDYSHEEVEAWLRRSLTSAQWLDVIRRDEVWVVTNGKSVLGFSHLAIMSETEGEILGFYLTPPVLNLGLGRKLFLDMQAFAAGVGVKRLSLLSTLTARDFYLRMGFTPTGELEKHSMGGSLLPAYPMECRL